jgi:hypothetical protein
MPAGIVTGGYLLYPIRSRPIAIPRVRRGPRRVRGLISDLESLSKEVPDVKRHAGNFEPAETVKSVPLDPSSDASKQIRIGSGLNLK